MDEEPAKYKYKADDILEVKLRKAGPDQIYGFFYRISLNDEVVVTSIRPKSIVDIWNQHCDSRECICIGDVILAANGKKEARQIVEEFKRGRILKLRLAMCGPRWHLIGTTSETLEKIHAAMELGIQSLEANHENEMIEEIVESNITIMDALWIILAIVLPQIVLVVLFSDMGFAIQIFNAASEKSLNMAGNGIIAGGVFSAFALYIADWTTWKDKIVQGGSAVLLFYLCCFGFMLKSRNYPAAGSVITLFHVPVFLGLLRGTVLARVRRGQFYKVSASALGYTGFGMMLMWLLWVLIGSNNKFTAELKEEFARRTKPIYNNWEVNIGAIRQERAKEFMNMASPIVVEVPELIRSLDLGGYERGPREGTILVYKEELQLSGIEETRKLEYSWDCLEYSQMEKYDFFRRRANRNGTAWTEWEALVPNGILLPDVVQDKIRTGCGTVKTTWFLAWCSPMVGSVIDFILCAFSLVNGVMLDSGAGRLEKVVRNFLVTVGMVCLGMWASASLGTSSMNITSTFMAFMAAGLFVLFIWMYLEIGKSAITAQMKKSKWMPTLVRVATSNWVRAMFIIATNILIPVAILIIALNQKVRRLRGKTTSKSFFTEGMAKIIASLYQWKWADIITKVNWIVIAYWILSVGVAKLTVVFLSWLNEILAGFHPVVVVVLFFLIGFLLFLLPPVPGIPIYVISGILLPAHSQLKWEEGVVIAIVLTFALKHTAVCGQYAIGYLGSKSVKVQQKCMVDSVVVKATERILLQRGLRLSKVAVLVGCPDWPTSALCGLLRLNLFQCLLGTTPVIFASAPCVLAGAFMVHPDDDITALSNIMMVISLCVQMGSGVIAMYYVQEISSKYSQELSIPRPEHAPVAALTLKEAEFVQAYWDAIDLQALPRLDRVLLALAFIFLMVALFFFLVLDSGILLEEKCWRSFPPKGRISDPFAQEGLDGNVLNIVLPLGWCGMACFFLGCIFHWLFLRRATRSARSILARRQHAHELQDNANGEKVPFVQDVSPRSRDFSEGLGSRSIASRRQVSPGVEESATEPDVSPRSHAVSDISDGLGDWRGAAEATVAAENVPLDLDASRARGVSDEPDGISLGRVVLQELPRPHQEEENDGRPLSDQVSV
mmetsp:Transcript_825/g.2049  ORF Transcript_825/g.2049 Transcript_825/m.2049 type:complete len:1120 (-) Transcript_825:99-3458(-)